MDVLPTYTHHSVLQVITASPLIYTLQTNTAPAKAFSSLLPSSAVPWQRLLTAEIL
jgi:hypothetical protein